MGFGPGLTSASDTPIDVVAYGSANAGAPALSDDLVARSKARGSGGRLAVGFLAIDAGTIEFTTGAGSDVTLTVLAGTGMEIAMKALTQWTGTNLLVFW